MQSRVCLIVGGTHPAPVEALVVLTDAINHSMMRSI
jgi:hypothetical protein